jgi:hypothetical protein
MQFLDTDGHILAEYPSTLPPNYLNFRYGAEEWLKAREDMLKRCARWVVRCSWVHEYLSDGNKIELEPMILSFLPANIEKQVLLERPDISGWDLSEEDWRRFLQLGINGRVLKPGERW